MDRKPKLKLQEKELTEAEEKMLEELAEVVVEAMRPDYHSELEPFDVYAKKVRSKLYENVTEFRKRFVNGYQVLIEEIRKQS